MKQLVQDKIEQKKYPCYQRASCFLIFYIFPQYGRLFISSSLLICIHATGHITSAHWPCSSSLSYHLEPTIQTSKRPRMFYSLNVFVKGSLCVWHNSSSWVNESNNKWWSSEQPSITVIWGMTKLEYNNNSFRTSYVSF